MIGLGAGALSLFMVMAILERRIPKLKAREQSYKLHELRDRLQILIIQDKITVQSATYSFLMPSLNLAIKNAGVLSLSRILELASAVNRNASDRSYPKIVQDVRRHDSEVQKLFDEFLQTLIAMLISNDKITSLMFTAAKYVAKEFNRAALDILASAGRLLLPEHTKAVYEAWKYQKLSGRIPALTS